VTKETRVILELKDLKVKEERTEIPEQQVLKDYLVHKASKGQLQILMLEQLKERKFSMIHLKKV
jgi:hypothetical protein